MQRAAFPAAQGLSHCWWWHWGPAATLPSQSEGEPQLFFCNGKLHLQVAVLPGERERESPPRPWSPRPLQSRRTPRPGILPDGRPCPLSHVSRSGVGVGLLAWGRGDHVQPSPTAKGFNSQHAGRRGIGEQSEGET